MVISESAADVAADTPVRRSLAPHARALLRPNLPTRVPASRANPTRQALPAIDAPTPRDTKDSSSRSSLQTMVDESMPLTHTSADHLCASAPPRLCVKTHAPVGSDAPYSSTRRQFEPQRTQRSLRQHEDRIGGSSNRETAGRNYRSLSSCRTSSAARKSRHLFLLLCVPLCALSALRGSKTHAPFTKEARHPEALSTPTQPNPSIHSNSQGELLRRNP